MATNEAEERRVRKWVIARRVVWAVYLVIGLFWAAYEIFDWGSDAGSAISFAGFLGLGALLLSGSALDAAKNAEPVARWQIVLFIVAVCFAAVVAAQYYGPIGPVALLAGTAVGAWIFRRLA